MDTFKITYRLHEQTAEESEQIELMQDTKVNAVAIFMSAEPFASILDIEII